MGGLELELEHLLYLKEIFGLLGYLPGTLIQVPGAEREFWDI